MKDVNKYGVDLEKIKDRKGTLPDEMLGQWKNPEVQAKAAATRKKNFEEKQKRKEAAQTGFGLSKLADPDNQAKLIDKLYEMAISSDANDVKFAMKMLSDMGVTKQPAEKPDEVEATKKENMSIEDSISILKRAQEEANNE